MDVMIDIETMANTSNSVILQIGAVVFDRVSGEISHKFKTNVEAQSGIDIGLEANMDTIEWWMSQSEEARSSIFAEPKQDICSALETLSNWFINTWIKVTGKKTHEYDSKDIKLWCHATFDEPILENAYHKCKLKTPWHFRSVRDIRTLVDLSEYIVDHSETNSGVAHDALDDCIFQVDYVVKCINKLKR